MGEFMDFMDDFVLGPLNLIDRVEGLLRLQYYRDSGVRFSIPRVDKGGSHTRAQARSILKRYGIATFGITHDAKCVHFLVKSRQAEWAEYLLLNAGLELHNPPVNPSNAGYPAQHPDGWMPTPWSEAGSTDTVRGSSHAAVSREVEETDSGSGTVQRILTWLENN